MTIVLCHKRTKLRTIPSRRHRGAESTPAEARREETNEDDVSKQLEKGRAIIGAETAFTLWLFLAVSSAPLLQTNVLLESATVMSGPRSFVPRGGPAYAMGFVLTASVGAVWYSHYAQVRDRAVMKAGVERDKERLRAMKQKQRPADPEKAE
jgi:hypothetical protein